MLYATDSNHATIEAGDYAYQLASRYGCGRKFDSPVECWAIIDDKPAAVEIVMVRGSCDYYNTRFDFAETASGVVLSSRYLYPRNRRYRKPRMAEKQDEYGVYHDWVAEGRKRPSR